MATREHQGLQIAVMIFFLLTIVLAVTTYVFIKNYTDERTQREAQATDLLNAQNSVRQQVDVITALKTMMGFTQEDEIGAEGEAGTITTMFSEDMQNFAQGYEGETKSYRQVLAFIHQERNEASQNEAEAKSREQAALNRLQEVEGSKDQQIVKYKGDFDKVTADAKSERDKFNEDRTRIQQGADAVAKQLDGKRNEMDDLVAKTTEEVKKISTDLSTQAQLNAQLTEKLRRDTPGVEVPDGRITWVNQRNNVVWINLGQADNLRRQTNFSIYPAGRSQVVDGERKGSIEVMRVIDQHVAEARILEDDLSNPILPGDTIASPAWARGRRDKFALIGFIDINGDDKSDRQKVRELITLNGGDIVCELQEDGKIKGKLDLDTRYIVLGDAPTGKEHDGLLLDNYVLLTGEGQKLAIEKISVSKFVNQMGYRPDERTVPLGRGARSADFPATPPEGVQRKSTGVTSGEFQKRKRPGSTY